MANTPFLDLVKPAGTDRALVSVINSNSDKIDGGVSTLSEQIGTKVGYDITDIYTGNVLEASAGLYRCPSTASNLPIASNGYLTVITRSTNLTFIQYVSDDGRMFINTRNSSSWSGWKELAVKSETIAGKVMTLSSGNDTYTFPAACGFVVFIARAGASNTTTAMWSGFVGSTNSNIIKFAGGDSVTVTASGLTISFSGYGGNTSVCIIRML